jgi:crossover junction endodeoxyribonuclease RusA
MSAAAQRAWREKNRDHVRAESRQRAKRRNHSEYMKAWRKKNRPKLRAKERRARLKRYGLTPDDYNRMVIAQNNCCAVCGRPSASLTLKNDRHQHFALDVDHCHATGKVRGLVCCSSHSEYGAWPNRRAARRHSFRRDGRGRSSRPTTAKNKGWQQLVAEAAGRARDEAGAALLEGPVRLLVAFYLPRPKSLPKKVAHHTKKPDLDKLLRSVKDGLKAVAWHDDSQVVDVKAIKRYADRGTAPHAIVTVQPAE